MKLFTPIKVGGKTLKNRVAMPAMHLNYTPGGEINSRIVEFYKQRAAGGAGLIIVGGCTVDERSGDDHMVGLSHDRFIAGLSMLSAAVKPYGACIAAQLYHAGRYTHSALIKQQPVSASARRSPLTGETPREMTRQDIEETIESFALAAARAVKAGFDAVEILGSAGYLISQFCSPATNCREDEYGGAFANRVRFALEVTQAVRAAIGPEALLIYRIAGNDFVPGGQTNQEAGDLAVLLEEKGVDMFNVTGGWHETKVPQIPMDLPRGGFAYLAQGIKGRVSVPVMACNRINHPDVAEAIVAQGRADMVGVARGMLADPRWAAKAQTGQSDLINLCIGCNQGCFDAVFTMAPVGCMVNPRAGLEAERDVSPAKTPKNILVAGGGAAGLAFAATAAGRGHRVRLMERQETLGGQIHLAARLEERAEFMSLINSYEALARQAGVEILTGREATQETLKREKPDALVVATGGAPIHPPFAGVDLPHVIQAWDLLSGRQQVRGGRAVVVGGGAVGVEAALFLSHIGALTPEELHFLFMNRAETPETLFEKTAHGHLDVTMIEMTDKIGRDIGRTTAWIFRQNLKRAGVKLMTQTKALEVTPEAVLVEQGGQVARLAADTVVLALGTRPEAGLAAAAKGLVGEVHVIGDAQKPAKAYNAVHAGFMLGREI